MTTRIPVFWISLALISLWPAASCASGESVPLEDLGVLPPADSGANTPVAAIRRLLASGEFDTAETRLEVAEGALSPAEMEFWHGVLELRRGDGSEAIRRLRRAQRLQDSPYTIELLGLAYYSVSQFHLFETFMLDAIRQLPKAFAPHYYLGRYYASTAVADFARGRQYLEQSIRLNPSYFRSFYYLGYCYESERRLEQAARAYGESIRLAKSQNHVFSLPYEGMARILTLQNELTTALTYANAAADISGQDPETHKTRAAIYDRQGRTLEAVKEWELVATLDPTNGAACYRLLRLYTEQGRKDAAARALEQFRKLARLYGTDNP